MILERPGASFAIPSEAWAEALLRAEDFGWTLQKPRTWYLAGNLSLSEQEATQLVAAWDCLFEIALHDPLAVYPIAIDIGLLSTLAAFCREGPFAVRRIPEQAPPGYGQEIGVNLWYVHDENGIIYSLRAKAYVVGGTDNEKLDFLQQRALLDYLIAQPFAILERFHITVGIGQESQVMPVAHLAMLASLSSPIALFEDALKVLEHRMPAQSEIDIPQDPLVCTTPLLQDEHGTIRPLFSSQRRY